MLFSFTINLRIKSNKKLSLDVKDILKQKPKIKVEKRLLITNNKVGKIDVLHEYVKNYFARLGTLIMT